MDYILSLDNIITIIGLLFGGGGLGVFFGWRYAKRKARAEARQAEAEAERAKYEAMQANAELTKTIQDGYQQMLTDQKENMDELRRYNEEQKQYINDLKGDRRHLREENDELRTRQDKLEAVVRDLQNKVARNGPMVECMRPLLCGREGCAIRQPVTISDAGEVSKPEVKDVKPIDHDDL